MKFSFLLFLSIVLHACSSKFHEMQKSPCAFSNILETQRC
ncbi:comB7 lipoprotein [Helicobacter suis]|nr:comB7 lipoprotein [Helicobacter suis]